MQRVIPALKDNGMADTPLPWPLMQAMLLELVRAERVPFEADPLTGLQVLGMLETRLLRFSRVFLVDVTDDRLPGAPIRSPLLPDSLRALLGLPDTRNREQLAAYTFHRLIAGADEVWLYWQEGVETSGLFERQKAAQPPCGRTHLAGGASPRATSGSRGANRSARRPLMSARRSGYARSSPRPRLSGSK